MAIRIWCPRVSDSARLLLGLLRHEVETSKSPRGQSVDRFLRTVHPEDMIVNWGSSIPTPPHVHALNSARTLNKRTQLITLYSAGVQCPEVYDHAGEGRIGRSSSHTGGSDLLNGTGRDYWTQRLDVRREIRIHVFRGHSIRAGIKIPREGMEPHPWIRSMAGGWRISYNHDHNIITNVHRDLAKRAVHALSLDFGAVDIGLVGRSNTPVVLEVNLAPGLDPGPASAYANNILNFYRSLQ